MTRAGRLLRNLLERLLGRYYEGPEPPARLREQVLVFAGSNRRATRAEWVEFAAGIAGEAWRTGYHRGLEWSERDLVRRDPVRDPEELVRAMGEGDRWLDVPVDLDDPAEVVQEAPDVVRELKREQVEYRERVEAYARAHQFQPPPKGRRG